MQKSSDEIFNIMRKINETMTNQDKKIEAIKYLGEIELEGKNKDIYLVRELVERKINGEMYQTEVDTYITEQLEKIAGNNHSDSYQYPMVVGKFTAEKENVEEQLQALNEEGLLDLGQMERRRLKTIAKAVGIKEEEIKQIDEIDLKQEIQEKQVSKNDLKGIDIKEETKLSQYIKGESLEKKLGLRDHGIEDGVTLARVSSSSLNKYLDKPTSQIDCFVVICKDGTAVALGEDILEPDRRLGTNPTKQIATANVEQGNVKNEAITSSWRIVNGSGRDYLSVGYDESYGSHREIKYMMASVKEKDYVSVELETKQTWRQDEDVRQYMLERGEGTRTADNALDRDEQHENCEKEEVQDIDNNKNNDTHTHDINTFDPEQKIPDTDITWNELAEKCNISVEEVYNKFQEKNREYGLEKTSEEIADEIEEEINEEYMHGGIQR